MSIKQTSPGIVCYCGLLSSAEVDQVFVDLEDLIEDQEV